MTTIAPTISPPKGFHNGAAWLHSLGDVSIERVVFDPWPGFATEDDLIRFVDGDQKRLCELVDGTLVEKVVCSPEAFIAAQLISFLGGYVRSRKLGAVFGADVMMRVRPGRVRLPDVAFVRSDRLAKSISDWEAVFSGSPDLAVEVISPGNPRAEMDQKLLEYFAGGTSLVWYIYPKDESVDVYTSALAPPVTLSADQMLSGGDTVPGFVVRVRDLFTI